MKHRSSFQKRIFRSVILIAAAALFSTPLLAHDHMPVGATTSAPGGTLDYAPTAQDFTTSSGWVFGLSASTTNEVYRGSYWTEDAVFAALAATPDDGGPEPGHAALGAFIQVKLLSVEGPNGSTFSFWEAPGPGVDSTSPTWTVPVPYREGTNLIAVSEGDGSPGSDPFGHVHGRVFSFTKPGHYNATWQFVDTSSNGPGGGPVDLPSAPFATQFQAGLTIANISTSTYGVAVQVAAPSLLPDNAGAGTQPAIYTVQSSTMLGPNATWQTVGDPILGDDHMHRVEVPLSGKTQFFRLSAQYPAGP